MKYVFCLVITASLLFVSPKSVYAETLSFPSDDAVVSLYYAYSNEEPPYEKWVKQTPDYKQASEFKRHSVMQELTEKYRAQIGDYKDIKYLKIRTGLRFGEYNGSQGGFPLVGIKDGTYYVFRQGGKRYTDAVTKEYRVPVKNPQDFRLIPLPPEEAEAFFNKSPSRRLQTILTFKINSAGPGKRDNFGHKVIDAHLESIELYDSREQELLYTLEAKALNLQENYVEKEFDLTKVDLNGLKIGMAAKDVKKWFQKNGFKIVSTSFHDYQAANDKGLLSPKRQMPDTNLDTVRAKKGTCYSGSGVSMSENIEAGDQCLYVSFSKGASGFLGGTPSKITSIEYKQAFETSDKSMELLRSLKEKYGMPYTISKRRGTYDVWGNGDGEKHKTYPFWVQVSNFNDAKARANAIQRNEKYRGSPLVVMKLTSPK